MLQLITVCIIYISKFFRKKKFYILTITHFVLRICHTILVAARPFINICVYQDLKNQIRREQNLCLTLLGILKIQITIFVRGQNFWN